MGIGIEEEMKRREEGFYKWFQIEVSQAHSQPFGRVVSSS